MTIIVGLQFIPSLVLIPFKCPPGIYFQILKQQLVNPKARSPLHPPSSCSPRCGPRFTGPFSFVCRFIFRVKGKKKKNNHATEALFFAKKPVSAEWWCHLCVPLGSLAVGSHTSEDKEGLSRGEPASCGPAARRGSSLPAHEPAEKSQVLWAPVSREM